MHCEHCGKAIPEGAKAHHCNDGVHLCFDCAPTMAETLEQTEARVDGNDDDPALTARVATRLAGKFANGAKLTDKDVW